MQASRRILRGAAVVVAVVLGFVAGVATGVVGSAGSSAPAATPTGVLDAAAGQIAGNAARAVSREDLERAAIEGMLGTLGDHWSAYYDAAEYDSFADAVEGSYSGVGVWLRAGTGGSVVVGSVQSGSPSSEAGVAPGDVLTSVDGASATSISRAAELLRGSGTARASRSAVRLTLSRDGATRTVSVRRASVESTDVAVQRLRGDVLRVVVSGFTRGTGRLIREAVAREAEAALRGVVLDLRGNPGGLLTEAVEVASAFLDGGAVVHYEQRGQGRRSLEALGDGDTTTPLVVLVDGGTASAAEIVAAALQDRNRAVVVGAPTYGKGSVQEPTRLPDGSGLEFTVGRYLTPSGRNLDGVGLAPDVLVRAGAAPVAAEERALDVLAGLQAQAAPARIGNG